MTMLFLVILLEKKTNRSLIPYFFMHALIRCFSDSAFTPNQFNENLRTQAVVRVRTDVFAQRAYNR